jgi:hypothetical protein
VWINDGETKEFPFSSRVVFDNQVNRDQYVVLAANAWDEDAAKDWPRNKEWIDKLTDTVLPGATAVVAGIFGGISGGLGGAAAAAGAAYGAAKQILPKVRDGVAELVSMDKDDHLGLLAAAIPANGPTSEMLSWAFNHTPTHWWDPNDTSWKYQVNYQVSRRPL